MTKDEAIVSILQEYLPLEKMEELYTRLDATVDDYSLKQSLITIKQLSAKESNRSPWWLWLSLQTLVITHGILVIGMIFAFFALPFAAPWYIALPLCTFIWFFSTSRVDCKLTNLENHLRVKLGKKRIGGFVGYYFIKPLKELI